MVPWSLAVLAGAVAIWGLVRPSPPEFRSLTRLVVNLPQGQQLLGGPSPPIAVSPDGTRLVYAAISGGQSRLYLRRLDQFEAKPIPGTEGANAPFFAPDGGSVGFFADGALKKVAVSGGVPLTIADAPWSASFSLGASWGPDDTIIFAAGLGAGLLQVSAAGGTLKVLTTPNAENGEVGHGWPQILPDGKNVLFTIRTGEDRRIALLSRETGEWRTILRVGTQATGARYLPTGHLVYAQSGGLLAVPVDLSQGESSRSPMSILDGVFTFGSGLAYFATSRSGALVYAPGVAVAAENSLVWVDRQGRATPLAGDRGTYLYPRLSPDGRRVAVAIAEGGNRDIWVYDVERGTRTRLTIEGINTDAVWTPDGKRLAFASNRAGAFNLYWKPADGSGEAEPLLMREEAQFSHSWSPDGRLLAFYELSPGAARDIWVLSRDDNATATPFLTTSFNERSPIFSPDGRWLAYVSNESGRDEVYVQPYPERRAKWLISTDGGTEPVWSAGGRELLYRRGDKMMAVPVETEPAFTAGQPRVLFDGAYDVAPVSSGSLNYDVSPDGERFVMIQRDQESAPRQLNVVLNWFDELERLAPTRRTP